MGYILAQLETREVSVNPITPLALPLSPSPSILGVNVYGKCVLILVETGCSKAHSDLVL